MINEIKEALEKATPRWHDNGNEIVSLDNPRVGIGGFLTEEDNHLAANAPEWLHYLISEVERLEIIEKQYKELTSIMDRARNVAIQESDNEEDKPLFWMDADGNLHRRTEQH